MSKTRYIIEGEWTGYRSSQQRIVHREVTDNQKLAEVIMKQYGIRYSDGTMLILRVRAMAKGERAHDLRNSYGSLIRDCFRYGCWSVDGLIEAKKAAKASFASISNGAAPSKGGMR